MAKKKQELFANYDFILTFAANTQQQYERQESRNTENVE